MAAAGCMLLAASSLAAAETFGDLVGAVPVGAVAAPGTVQVPFIVWGGDVATFHANGGLETKPETLYQKQGLSLKLVPGDNFVQQVRDYLAGKSPLLRGTFHMIGMASEVIGSDPRTKGVVLFQMTWSAGDHAVCRERLKTLKDLRGAKVCLQKGGPHEGLLDDLLRDAGLKWDAVTVVWARDLSGTDDSPAALFRKDPSIDVCFVISPDMLGLTSGLQSVGTGVEGTVKGARVLASTADRSRSIADVYVVRKDFLDANRAWCEKFTAGYLRACEELADMKKEYEGKGSPQLKALLAMAQTIYGKEVLPLEQDAYGLILDCIFVGYRGNVKFFTAEKNLTGFEAFQEAALNLAATRGYAKVRTGMIPSPLDWNAAVFTSLLTKMEPARTDRFIGEAAEKEIAELNLGGTLDQNTIYEFSIGFKANQEEFSAVQYGAEFQRVVEFSAKYANAVIAVRGHSDPTKVLLETVQAGMQKGILKRTGTRGDYKYYLQGKPLDIGNTKELAQLIEHGDFDGVAGASPRDTMQAALNLSRKRAEAVKAAVMAYAKGQGLEMEEAQVQPVGVGVAEPVIAKPTSMAEAEANMRVEFRLVRVKPEVMTESEFDF